VGCPAVRRDSLGVGDWSGDLSMLHPLLLLLWCHIGGVHSKLSVIRGWCHKLLLHRYCTSRVWHASIIWGGRVGCLIALNCIERIISGNGH